MALVQAAVQLEQEITDLFPDAEVETLPEVDGLGFNREVRIDAKTAKDLPDEVVAALEQDERISEIVKSSKGLRVVFVPSVLADYRQPYDLASVLPASGQE